MTLFALLVSSDWELSKGSPAEVGGSRVGSGSKLEIRFPAEFLSHSVLVSVAAESSEFPVGDSYSSCSLRWRSL